MLSEYRAPRQPLQATPLTEHWHCRVLSGLLNSNAGISKTYLGESCTKQQQPAAFATFCVMYGLGSVIAPAIGGFLRYSKLGKDPGLVHPSLMHMRMAMLVHATHNP